jgi:twitching motility protein PilT
MDELLREAIKCGASDIHVTVALPPLLRINGELRQTNQNPLRAEDTDRMLSLVISAEQRHFFNQRGEIDFAYSIPGLSRFRINAFRQRGTTAMAIRVITEKIPTLEQLHSPEVVKSLARKNRGLVLVTGPTGSGKSTTLAAMINLINYERACHIITIEDPIEYLHQHQQSIINQREINSDTRSFATALRAALREDPDVILVGEMRDAETISTAITAAETGHLVFGTVHTGDAAQTVDRIIDVFPPYQQHQIRSQLALTIQGIIAQQLVPTADCLGRIAALEILLATPAVRNLIREGKTHQILSVLQTGAEFGMQSMDMALRELVHQDLMTYEAAQMRATDPENFSRLLSL